MVLDTASKKETFVEASKIEKAEPIRAQVVAKVGESLVINKGTIVDITAVSDEDSVIIEKY